MELLGTLDCSGLGAFQMEESTPSTLSLYILLQGSPGKLGHSCRLHAAGNTDDFPASRSRGETHGKGASLTTHSSQGKDYLL